jgi:dipeptidyl aminopeptidase/acylaminoacyl peptidase
MLTARLMIGLLIGAAGTAVAEEVDRAAEAFFATPQFESVRLAPSGEHLAALVPAGAGQRLLVMAADRSRARLLPAPAEVRDYRWATDERLLLVTGGPGDAPGLAAVNRDGSALVSFAAPADGARRVGVSLLDLLPREPASVLITDDRRVARAPDAYRINIFDGSRERVARNPGRVFRWWTDRLGRVRLALAWAPADGGVRYALRHRFGGEGSWHRMHDAKLGGPFMTPLAFGADNRYVFVASSVDRDTTAVRRYDTHAMTLGPVVHARAGVDVSTMEIAPGGGVAAVRYEGGRPDRVQLEGDPPDMLSWLDEQLPEAAHRIVSRSRDGGRAVVLAHDDRQPGRYFLLDTEPMKLTPIASRLPWLEGRLGPRRPVAFQARDGRRLTGYLSLPAQDEKAGPAPLLIMPHGGPWARDHWGFDAPAQYFAAEGFAVLQVNFRGSRGFGRDHLMAGRGEWDAAMLDDLADGVRWAVARGHADPERVAILGASFGGYAALMSAVRYPDVYGSAVSFGAVTDLPAQLRSLKEAGDERAWSEWRFMVGDPDEGYSALVHASPLNHARAFRVPTLLAHGAKDGRVAPAQALAQARAMDRAGAPVRFMLMEDAVHALANPARRAGFYAAALDFIRESLDG